MKTIIVNSLFACLIALISSSAMSTSLYRLSYNHQENTIEMIDVHGANLGFWFDLKTGSLKNSTRSADTETATFFGQIERPNRQIALRRFDDKQIALTHVPEHLAFLTCENGEFKVLDACSPKQCGFMQGAILLSVKCRSQD